MLAITEQGRPKGGQAGTFVLGRHMWGPGKSAEIKRTGKVHWFGVEDQDPESRRSVRGQAPASSRHLRGGHRLFSPASGIGSPKPVRLIWVWS